jgi:dsRNA-specific ribonuclease
MDIAHPFNPLNKLLTEEVIVDLLIRHGVDYKPKDVSLYNKAFLHRSYCTRKNDNIITGNVHCPKDCIPLQEESNERLEFLGDAILNFVVADYLYERYPNVNEGFLTKVRTNIVNGNKLAELSGYIDLGQHLIISQQLEQNNGRTNKKNLEDVFESLIGAIYLDFNQYKIDTEKRIPMLDQSGIGFQIVTIFIINVLETYIDFSTLVVHKDNPKDTFIKLCQHNFQWTPKFYEINVCEKDNIKEHTISVKNNEDFTISIANGPSRKLAEINASVKALQYYGWN